MSDEASGVTQPLPESRSRRAAPAAVELLALCRSLAPDGRLSHEDVQALGNWTAKYSETLLPSHADVSEIVKRALECGVMTMDERGWLDFAVEPALPRQLQRNAQEQRRRAEVDQAQSGSGANDGISFDFLLGGSHLEAYRYIIQSGLRAGAPVRLVRDTRAKSGGRRIRVDLMSGLCIGFVPDADAPPIALELARIGSMRASVKKILSEGQYPIPVIGGRMPYAAATSGGPDVGVAITPSKEPERDVSPEPPLATSRLAAIGRALEVRLRPFTSRFR